MKKLDKKIINWDKTAINLKLLRNDNINLRRYVCKELKYDLANCSGDCLNCKYDMDNRISQAELAEVFNVSENMIVNWENCKSRPSIEDILFYSDICNLSIFEILVFEK